MLFFHPAIFSHLADFVKRFVNLVYGVKEAALKDLMNRALDLARLRGASYADIRVVHNRTETIAVRDGVVEIIEFC